MSIELVKKLRQETGIGISECKDALEESGGDIEKAKEVLKKKGKEIAASKSMRQAQQGLIESYIHATGKVGVLVEVRCESDFVTKSDKFRDLVREIAMQIAAMSPTYISKDNIPDEIIEKEKSIYLEQMGESDKPAEMMDKILNGKIDKWSAEIALLNQKWIKDDKKTIKDLVDDLTSQLGEKIEVTNFARFEI
jgi:elongation factor Ts